MIVTALQSFDHGRSWKRGDTLNVTSVTAKALREKGLVSFTGLDGGDTPPLASGEEPSSASPVAPPSPQTTATESDAGEKPAKKKAKKEKTDE